MFTLIYKSSLIAFYPPVLINSTLFIFILGFIYGYGVNYILELKKAISIGFFAIILTAIFLFSISGIYLLSIQCSANSGINNCDGPLGAFGPAANTLLLSLTNLVINIIIGHLGFLFGVIFYLPSYYLLKKIVKISAVKSSVIEYDNIISNSTTVTFGNKSLLNKT